MVCSKCESKLAKVACPDPWKDGARNTKGGKDGGRAVGENKALSASKRFMPYASKCGVCKQSLHQQGIFCQTCAYSKGVCAMCGIKILDVTYYRQSGAGDVEAAARKREEANAAFERECAEEAAKRAENTIAPALSKLSAPPAAAARPPAGAHATAALAMQAAAAGSSGGDAFQAARSWLGPRPGYYFGTDTSGTGYYADAEQRRMASAHTAAAAVAAAAAARASAAAAAAPSAAASTGDHAATATAAPPMLAGGAVGAASAAGVALEMVSAGIAPRNDPTSLALAAAARGELTGGSLTSAMGAAGRVMQAKPTDGAPPPGWQYDPGSGFYFDAPSQAYFDPNSKLFFNCASNTWSAVQPGGGTAGAADANGGVRKRVVDKWGL